MNQIIMRRMKKTMIKFYDTSSLILDSENLFNDNEKFIISSITLDELENLKSSNKTDLDKKIAVAKLLH
jgi:rRNA-processing protein FCF1